MKSGKLTEAELKALFPNASLSTYKVNGVIDPTTPDPEIVPAPDCLEAMRQAAAKGIRPGGDIAALNETEKRYLRFLQGQQPAWLGVQCITLKMGFDLRYTPDFWAIDNEGIRAIDVKGPHIWEDSLVKIRICARLFPWARFLLARENGLVWDHKEVKT